MPCIAYLPEYQAIVAHYGDRVAHRSKVPLINHINEGVRILRAIDASVNSVRGFCLHPLFQTDDDLQSVGKVYLRTNPDPYVVMLTMEYRHTANAYLSHCVMSVGGIKLSPLKEVNDMLIADKVQNRKDFEIYHKGTHERSARLDQYFKEWLDVLGISEQRYQELKQHCGS